CRFVDNACTWPAKPGDKGLVAGLAVGETAACAVAHAMGIEMVFRDVDADGIFRHLSLVLCLSSAAKLRVSVQASRERRGRSDSSSTRRRSAVQRSHPRR